MEMNLNPADMAECEFFEYAMRTRKSKRAKERRSVRSQQHSTTSAGTRVRARPTCAGAYLGAFKAYM